jgi:hypothetical protein
MKQRTKCHTQWWLTMGMSAAVSACGGYDTGSEMGETPAAEEFGELTQELVLQTQTAVLEVEQDTRIQAGSPNQNFGAGQLWINTEASHYSLVEFDLNALPADATIESARFVLYFTGNYAGERIVELGRVESDWAEMDVTWDTRPTIDWAGPAAPVNDAAGEVTWDVTSLVQAWHAGDHVNEGFALRGQNNGPGKIFSSKEMNPDNVPRLEIRYTAPVVAGPIPDLGDAPDSTNHHGVVNFAYPGVPAQFPTVWNMAGVRGPRHANAKLWGFLGQGISPEIDADVQPDSDGPSNILVGPGGAVSPNFRNNDRLDEGWKHRQRMMFNCVRENLDVRVSRASSQTGTMYLNVYFDGNSDGDWADAGPCSPPAGGAAQLSYEWIVQNFAVDMNAITPGGFVDLQVPTERVLNTMLNAPHWMRFTLSETPAVLAPGGLADGRGPSAVASAIGFKYGETEDYLHFLPPGQAGTLTIEKNVLTETTVPYAGIVDFELRLKHEGGTAPMQAVLRDVLPLAISEMHVIEFPEVERTKGAVTPLSAQLGFDVATVAHEVTWEGALAPDSELVVRFPVHVHPNCFPFAATKRITNVAQASGFGQNVSDSADFLAACPNPAEPIPAELDWDVLSESLPLTLP